MRAPIYQLSLLSFLLVAGCTTYWQQKKAVPTQTPQQSQQPYSGNAFDEHIRTTEARSPADEKAGFTLPPGFEIELFASEPQIGKPINLAFDAKGRLWVTQSVEYPFPAQPGNGHDRLTILEDRDHDGKADTFTPVSDTLNIPIGIMPVQDGALAFSIPNVYQLTDANGDDKLEASRRLLGPFGFKDTHGMVNHFRRGFDGWIHACHGFTNLSKIAGSDGDSITLGSGNTFRFRQDGSRVEQTTFGRVNPFGLTFDDWGYLYSSDCHSSPLYQLIRGAEYPYFGRLPEGIGFAPLMKPHEREATALSGLALSSGTTFPESYRNSLFMGDVVKCRIYRSSFAFKGSSPVGKMEEDFLRSADPWFRPADVVQGPDGALYIADFYNRIIGHYEVPLDNPGRDHVLGRIWRITYKGQVDKNGLKDWTKAGMNELLDGLSADNLSVRMTVADQLIHRIGKAAVKPVEDFLNRRKTAETAYAQGLWVLHQLGALRDETLLKALQNPQPLVRTHALRIVREMKTPGTIFQEPAKTALSDANPHVQRAAVEALATYPNLETVKTLVAFQQKIPAFDTHLAYTTRLCLRNLLRQKPVGTEVALTAWNQSDQIALTESMIGVNTVYASEFLLKTLKTVSLPKETELKMLRQTALYLPPTQRDDLVRFIIRKYQGDPGSQYKLFTVIQQSIKQQGGVVDESVRKWGIALAESLISPPASDWTYAIEGDLYLKDKPVAIRIPPVTTLLSPSIRMFGFDLGGLKGVVRSPVFVAPSSLVFSTVNYNMKTNTDPENRVQLRLADDTTKIIAQKSFLKANDYQAETVIWDLRAHEGKRVYLELVDQASGLIWIGDFRTNAIQVPAINPKEQGEQQRFAIETAGESGITALEPTLQKLLTSPSTEYFIKVASMRALLRLAPERYAAQAVALLGVESSPLAYRKEIAGMLGEFPLAQTGEALADGLKKTTGDVQLELLKALATNSDGKDLILKQVRNGILYTRILRQPGLEDRLLLNASPKQQAEFTQLTANLSPIDESREALIKDRLAHLDASATGGRQIFIQTCSPCHQINKEGGMIGPQLDGIGSWGSQSLATKILDPNRNISEAFRTYTIKLKNGSVKTGLFRREEAASVVYANAAGEEFFVPKKDIAESQASKYTLMPDHFGQTIPQAQFNQLLGYLLSVK
jgi:putative heme-binding domain-containing protein